MAPESPSAHRYWIADAHADSLFWNRDLTQLSSEGHVDFPRLQAAGVGLQCFTLVTRGYPFVGGFPLFAAYRRWPLAAMRSPWSRAVWQLEQMARFCEKSNDMVRVTRSRAELLDNQSGQRISAVVGVEGAHALEGDISRLEKLYALGVRFMGLAHLANNEFAGSSFPGMRNKPVTPDGKALLDAMAARGMSVDLAHASRRSLEDILSHPKVRPFCSHTGVAAISAPWRNLDDATLRRVADKGGVVGIILTPVYLGGKTIEDVVRHISHAVKVMGEDGVGLGSDFDGMVPLPKGMRDVRDLPKVLDAMAQAGFSQRQVEKVAGANLKRFFEETLG